MMRKIIKIDLWGCKIKLYNSIIWFLLTQLVIKIVFFSFVLDLSDYHLPFLYSCISFIGVLFLLSRLKSSFFFNYF
jgi:hypothetical protein